MRRQLDAPEAKPIIQLGISLIAVMSVVHVILATQFPQKILLLGLTWLLTTALIIYFCSSWLKKITKPIKIVTDQLRAARMGEVKYEMVLNNEGWFSGLYNEIFHYVRQTTSMRAEIERDREQLSQAITDIAHQLRTPIAVTENLLELVDETNLPKNKTILLEQNERLADLVAQLILLARVDTHTLGKAKQPIKLSNLLQKSLNYLLPTIADGKISLDYQVDSEIDISVNLALMQEALVNVLKNAFEHADQDTTVEIIARETPIAVILEVNNSGPTIAEEDFPHLFERFYRGENSAKNNLGVGLAITKGIMQASDGRIMLKNLPDGVQYQLEWFK